MNRFLLFIFALMMTAAAQAQFINNGATVTIQSGATLRVETSFENQAGTITIDDGGILEVQGNFTNATGTGTTISPTGKVRFIGTGNSDVTLNGDELPNVEMAKTTSAGKVTLLGNASINGNLEFTGTGNNKIDLGDFDLSLYTTAIVSATTDHTTNGYVATGGTGRLVNPGLGTTAFTYPVGFNATTYNPISISENGTADNIGVRVLEHAYVNGSNGTQITTEAVNATWAITEANAGSSNLNLTAQWNLTDELPSFTRNDCGVGRYNGTTYDLLVADLSAASGSGPYTRSRNGVTPGNFMVGDDKALDYVAVNVKVFLGGPSFSSNEMGDQLRSADLVPLNQPYSSAPYNATFAHAGRGGKGIEFVNALADFDKSGSQNDAVDWVFLELRSDLTTVVASKSAILQRDGDVVEAEDGSPVRFTGINDGNYHVVVRHRNHLGVMTNSVVFLSSTPLAINFTDGSVGTYGTNAQKSASGIFSLWPGDVNGDKILRYSDSGNDRILILQRIGVPNVLATTTGYHSEDVNMDGIIRYSDSNNDRIIILQSIGVPNVLATRNEQIP
ncbi:MAG: hypothetical protein IPK35_08595 [Saprospiraceae bacterium]|nr:hypothetical protein [Saprospiraceae bacterium]